MNPCLVFQTFSAEVIPCFEYKMFCNFLWSQWSCDKLISFYFSLHLSFWSFLFVSPTIRFIFLVCGKWSTGWSAKRPSTPSSWSSSFSQGVITWLSSFFQGVIRHFSPSSSTFPRFHHNQHQCHLNAIFVSFAIAAEDPVDENNPRWAFLKRFPYLQNKNFAKRYLCERNF